MVAVVCGVLSDMEGREIGDWNEDSLGLSCRAHQSDNGVQMWCVCGHQTPFLSAISVSLNSYGSSSVLNGNKHQCLCVCG